MKKKYYSIRNKKQSEIYNLNVLNKLFLNLYLDFEEKGYLQQYFGYWCVDANTPNSWVLGSLGSNIDNHVFNALLKDNLWPIKENIKNYKDGDLFDIAEFLFDYISKPVKGNYHSFNDCGMHYSDFDQKAGQTDFLDKINEIIINYGHGFEMSNQGQIFIKEEVGLTDIYKAKIPTKDEAIKTKINFSIQKYRGSRSDMEERRIAIRELADILESLRPKIKEFMLSKDDDTLFNLANNFYIRHSNDKQVKKYDKNIWYSWMFYFYLSTIYALLSLIKEHEKS